MPEIVDWQGGVPQDALQRAVEALAAGQLVALPTESGAEVAAGALQPNSVARLNDIAGDDPLAVVVTGLAEATDWLPFLGYSAVRLLRKFGPGPWKLLADGGADFGLLRYLPAKVQAVLCPERHLALRWPEHASWEAVARRLKQPLVSIAVRSYDDERVALVVDDRLAPAGSWPTLLRVTGKQWQIERPGAMPAETLEELLACRVLFVCTGNTCRSPMAEALMRRLLADRLGCPPEALRQRGFLVQSAGLAAMIGSEASPDAVVVVRESSADLSMHRSRRLTLEQLMLADHVFAMTESHLWALESLDVPDLPTPRLLAPGGEDVPDPIGAEPEVYRACAQEILGHLQKRLPEILCE